MPVSNESATSPLLDQSINQSINHSDSSYVSPSSHYDQSTNQSTNRLHNGSTFPSYQSTDQSHGQSINQQPHSSIQMDQPINQSTNQSLNQSMYPPLNQSTAPSTNQSINQPINPSMYQPLYQAAPHLRHLIRERQQPPYDQPINVVDLWSNFLSRGTKAFLLLIGGLWLIMFAFENFRLLGAFLPILFIPALIFGYLVNQRSINQQKNVEINLVFHQFIIGFSALALVTLIIETLLTIVFACVTILPFHFDEVKKWFNEQIESAQTGQSTNPEDLFQGFSLSPAFFVFLFLISFCVAGCVEEGAKGWLGLRIKKITPGYRDKDGWLMYLIAGALGFSTFENIAYATAVTTPALSVFINVLTRAFISTPLHLCCTYLVGVGIVRRDVFGQSINWLRIFALPISIHGGFDFALMICAAVMDPEDTMAIVAEFIIVIVTFVLIGLMIHFERKHIAGEPPILPTYAPINSQGTELTHQPSDQSNNQSTYQPVNQPTHYQPSYSSTQLAPM